MQSARRILVSTALSCTISLAHADASYYIGGDAGLSRLKPEVTDTAYTNESNHDFAYGILGGFSFSPRGRIEAQYHKLGAVEVGLNGVNSEIEYDVFNFDVNYSLWQNKSSQFFAAVGLTALDTNSNLAIEKDNSTNIKLGGGYEYLLNPNWSTRIAYSQFSGDAGLLSFGLHRHFGQNSPEPVIEATPAPLAESKVIPSKDQDFDGVMDDQDSCPDTLQKLQVDKQGCSIVFDYRFPEINFEFNSTKLTQSAQRKLDEIAVELKKVTNKKIEVQAHTDAIGSDFYNIWLSNKRAESIVSYLVSKGIPSAQLLPKGYGETMPVASNTTDSGRAQNRRAEFKLAQ
jgi:outer membrane protein OmpA-like peptidoglycan-associated protein